MRRLPLLLLVALLIAAGAILYATAENLPPRVASSFNFAGNAGGFMSRGTYLAFMAAAIFGASAIILLVCAVLPRLAPRLVNIPAREYWLAPERREETYASLAASGALLGCLVTAFLIGLHLLVVEANAHPPPRLDSSILWALIGALAVSVLAAQFFFWRRFRLPG